MQVECRILGIQWRCYLVFRRLLFVGGGLSCFENGTSCGRVEEGPFCGLAGVAMRLGVLATSHECIGPEGLSYEEPFVGTGFDDFFGVTASLLA